MARPLITLPADYVAQTRYAHDKVGVLKVDDDDAAKSLRVFVQLGPNPDFKYWVPVLSGNAYTENWTQAQVTAAVLAFFAAL